MDRWKKTDGRRGWPREFEGSVKGSDCSREKWGARRENGAKVTQIKLNGYSCRRRGWHTDGHSEEKAGRNGKIITKQESPQKVVCEEDR